MEKIGVEAVWQNENFQKGMNSFVDGLKTAIGETEKATSGMTKLGMVSAATGINEGILASAASALGIDMAALTAEVSVAAAVIGGILIAGIAAAIAAIVALGAAVVATTAAFANFVIEGLPVAEAYEHTAKMADFLGQKMGFTQQQIDAQRQSLVDTGARWDAASEAMAKFYRYGLDVTQMTNLLKVAQDASVITEKSVGETFNGLIEGIIRGTPRMLFQYGIVLKTKDVYAAYADTIGKTASELSETERQQAMLNAVLAEGTQIAGMYSAFSKDVGVQERGLTGDIRDLRAEISGPYTEAWANVIMIKREFIGMIASLVGEGGALHSTLVNIGAAVTVLSEYMLKGAQQIAAWIGGFSKTTDIGTAIGGAFSSVEMYIVGFTGLVTQTAANAFQWGANIIINFANGIINTAASVLTAAMNYISNLLTSWLAPGSPPQVAPEIDQWGKTLLEEYLSGFTKGDFDILSAIENPLRTALSAISVEAPKMAGKMYARLSQEIIAAIAGGEVSDALYERIRASTGIFGDAMVELVEREMALRDAVNSVADAQDRLNEARNQEERYGAQADRLIKQYNDMIRLGASDEVLKAKLAEINAAEEQRNLAAQNAALAQEQLDSAQTNVTQLQEQADLQEQVVNQMTALYQASHPAETVGAGGAAAAAAAAGGGGGGGGGAGASLAESIMGGFVEKINEEFQKAKENIRLKIQEFITLFKTALTQKWQEVIQNVTTSFYRLRLEFEARLIEIRVRAELLWDEMKTAFATKMEDIRITINTKLEEIRALIKTIFDKIKPYIDDMKKKWDELKLAIQGVVTALSTNLKNAITRATEALQDTALKRAIDTIVGWLTPFKNMVSAIAGFLQNIVNLIKQIGWDALKDLFGLSGDLSTTPTPTIPPPIPIVPDLSSIGASLGSTLAMAPATNITYILNFGGQNFNSPMDWAAFKSMVIQAISEA